MFENSLLFLTGEFYDSTRSESERIFGIECRYPLLTDTRSSDESKST